MTRSPTVRDRWIKAVLKSDLNNSAKVVCIALGMQMDDNGRVRYPAERLAADVGMQSVRRISDRLKEARDAGYLTKSGGGFNGTVSQYYAELPGTPPRGTSTSGRGGGLRGTRNGEPSAPSNTGEGSPPRGDIRARTTEEPPTTDPAPALIRGLRNRRLTLVGIDTATTTQQAPIEAQPSATTTHARGASA